VSSLKIDVFPQFGFPAMAAVMGLRAGCRAGAGGSGFGVAEESACPPSVLTAEFSASRTL
jgi:hypothetical protein